MARSSAKISRIRELQRAARSIASDGALRDAIAESTGLTRAGVDLAFAHHLELDASDADLEKLIARANEADAVTVVLSANVFVGALRAIALALAASDNVTVRPSRRDPAFATGLCKAGNINLRDEVDIAAITRGEIHVYGKDETIADVKAKAKVPVRGHGSGMGAVWLSSSADVVAAARAVADDVVVFDQRGCLSPRVVLVDGQEKADAFADALHEQLEDAQSRVPRGEVASEERAASARYIATMTYAGRALVGTAHAIGIGTALVSAPAYRHVHVIATSEPRPTLAPVLKAITTIGSDDLIAARAIAPAWARIAKLGTMQRPPLDGPVDLRTT